MYITEKMYLFSKKIVNTYEQKENNNSLTRNYSFADMKKCFTEGSNRGIFVASVIMNRAISKADTWEEFIEKFNKEN